MYHGESSSGLAAILTFLSATILPVPIVGGEGAKALAVFVLAANIMALDKDFLDIAALHRGHKFAEDHLRRVAMLLVENAKNDQENQRQHQPKGNMFR
jgi:hypothetical protein